MSVGARSVVRIVSAESRTAIAAKVQRLAPSAVPRVRITPRRVPNANHAATAIATNARGISSVRSRIITWKTRVLTWGRPAT
jgi:hypothetical protein